jgi:type IV pilus assembly protein PilV
MMISNKKQVGVGMIEVLITVLILAVGLLGVVAMQLTAKRNSYEATQRSIANSVARDIIERIRSNPDEIASYVVDDLGGSSLVEPTSCNTSVCTTAELAVRDLYEWELLLDGASEQITEGADTSNAGGLLSPRACITNNGGNLTVAIAWRGMAELANPDESTCGEGLGLYGAGEVQRRLLVMTTYVSNI